jgi:hypothetical protein
MDGAARWEAPARNYHQVRDSPNGQHLAVVVQAGIADWDIWTLDVAEEAGGWRVG